jgi:hypothetical protein
MIRRLLVSTSVIALMASAPIRAQQDGAGTYHQIYHLSKTFTDTQPCTGETVTGELDAVAAVVAALTPGGALLASITVTAHGELVSSDGTVYHASFAGNEHFDTIAAYYDVPLHAIAISGGSAPNFKADGLARIFADGSPVEVTFTPFCGS